MDYNEAVAIYFTPQPDGALQPEVVRNGGPARQLRDACEPIAMHAVWSRRTSERLAQFGLDFFASYLRGRAANLGEPMGSVVAATFAWFEPGLVASAYDTALAAVPREELLVARDKATAESLREILGSEDPTEVADLLAEAMEHADGTGRPLFSGLLARRRPTDEWQRLWWACDLVREHRGDSHVAAAIAAGLGPVEMNVLTELWLGMPLLSYTGTRGWSAEAMAGAVAALDARGWLAEGELTEAGRTARAQVEACTDAQEQTIVDALGDRFEEVSERLSGWSDSLIAAGAFPPDLLKRAAG